MEVKNIPIKDIKPYERNAKKHPAEQVEHIANSIKKFGWQQPVVIDKNGEVVIGHGRLLAAKKLKMKTVPVVVAEDLTEEEIRALRLADNKTNESAWDFDALESELAEIDSFDMADFGFDFDIETELEEAKTPEEEIWEMYSKAVGTVTYEPKETNHAVDDLYEVDNSFDAIIDSLTNENLKKMLRLRSAWFADFHFDKIADYYAYQATAEEQEAMEALGLVLLDKDGLIKNGFADLLGDVDGVNDDDD